MSELMAFLRLFGPLAISLAIAFAGPKKLKVQDIKLNVHKRQRFERIRWVFNEQIPAIEIPVMFLRGSVLRDTATGKNLLQLKFINTREKEIKSVYAEVSFIDDAGDMVSNGVAIQAEYLDINCKGHDTFGQKLLLELGGIGATHIRVTVKKVVFADGCVWRAERKTEPSKPAKVTFLKNVLPPELQNAASEDVICKPEVLGGELWRCTCGCLTAGDSCLNCGRTFAQAREDTSIGKLEQQLQKKAAEQERWELDKRIEKKTSKSYLIQLVFAILAYYIGIPRAMWVRFYRIGLLFCEIPCFISMIATSVLVRKVRKDGGIKDSKSIKTMAKIQGITALMTIIAYAAICVIKVIYVRIAIVFVIPNLLYCIQLPFVQSWLLKLRRKMPIHKEK